MSQRRDLDIPVRWATLSYILPGHLKTLPLNLEIADCVVSIFQNGGSLRVDRHEKSKTVRCRGISCIFFPNRIGRARERAEELSISSEERHHRSLTPSFS